MTVAMKRDYYEEKVNELLQDRDTYVPRTNDTSKQTAKKVVKLIKNWESSKHINDHTAKCLKVSHAIPSLKICLHEYFCYKISILLQSIKFTCSTVFI